MRFSCPAAGVKKSWHTGCTSRDSGLLLIMGSKRAKTKRPTHEELIADLEEAVSELQEAFHTGDDGSVSRISGRVRAIEAEIKKHYYSRWGS